MNYPQSVRGDRTGVSFPTSVEALIELGPAFLTEAFQATGALSKNNAVKVVTQWKEFFGGGAGRKLRFSVVYERPEDGLHTELFAKFPRDFGDPLRDLFSHLMKSETQFALLSRRPNFPVPVPTCYFADYDSETSTGLLITECIAFGQGNIEPFYDKCLDTELPRPLEHYQALVRVVAKLSGSHKAGCFGGEIEKQFPYDVSCIREDDRIPHSPAALQEKLAILSRFAERYPGLLPANVSSQSFMDQFASEAMRFLEHELPIKRFLNSKPELVALSHWNANVDNAWFVSLPDGGLEAGLLDWGSAGQMNIAQAVYGILCACETTFWDAHKDDLIVLFVEEYRRHGGADIEADELRLHVQLFVAMLGLAWMIDAPSIIEAQIPHLYPIQDRFDPKLRSNFLARAQLQLMVVFLNAWQTESFGAVLARFLSLSQERGSKGSGSEKQCP